MKSKLNLDPKVVDSARSHAANIAHDMQAFIDRHTTVSTERTILRLLGIDGVDDVENPLPNVVVDQIKEVGGHHRKSQKKWRQVSWMLQSFLPAPQKKQRQRSCLWFMNP